MRPPRRRSYHRRTALVLMAGVFVFPIAAACAAAFTLDRAAAPRLAEALEQRLILSERQRRIAEEPAVTPSGDGPPEQHEISRAQHPSADVAPAPDALPDLQTDGDRTLRAYRPAAASHAALPTGRAPPQPAC